MQKVTTYLSLAIALMLFGCTKEVQIDIPGYQEQVVIDGSIETGQPPIVLISRSKEVYAPTDLDAFLSGFVSGATVTVSDGTTTVQLDEICTNNLPPGSEEIVAGILGVPESELANYNICAYATFNSAIFGQVGKTYSLNVSFEGNTYTAETTIMPPTSLVNTWWQAENSTPGYGFSWCTLSDPPNQFDAYKWEVKRIATDANGEPEDDQFQETSNPVFDDEFFDGLTFNFWYENPFADDPNLPDEQRFLYEQGDTVIIKLSKMDRNVFEYMEKKYTQLGTSGNPFATPTNIPNNITGGALGVWAGFSPSFDTLVCVP